MLLFFYVGVWAFGSLQGLSDPGALLWRLDYIGLDGRILKLAPFFLVGALLARIPGKMINPFIAIGCVGILFFASNSAIAILILWFLLPYCVIALAFHAPKQFNGFGKHGDFSYGLYLYAFPIQQILSFCQVTHWPTHVMGSVILALTLAVVSWKFIESKALSFKATSDTRENITNAST